jgi:hypothetical protein
MSLVIELSLKNNLEVHYFVNDPKVNYVGLHKYVNFNFNALVFLLMPIAVYVIEISRHLYLLPLSK